MTASGTQTELDALAQEILNDGVCPPLRDQATQLVMGDGNPLAQVVLIGEAPGKNEDIQGKPFVGAAGKFLNTMLAAAGLDRDNLYITNIVKYRPPENRDPTPAEKAEFGPYLGKQLEIIKPKIIATLGKHSMEYFLPNAKISDIHGQPQEVTLDGQRYTVMPLFHPSYAQYNGAMRPVLAEDIKKLAELVDQRSTKQRQ